LDHTVLGQIWTLADNQQRGALGPSEFVVAMHLIASYKSGALRVLPGTLPPGLFEAASRAGRGRPAPPQGASQGIRGMPPVPIIPKQFSGSQPGQPSPLGRPNFGTPPQTAQTTGSDWAISSSDKTNFDNVFATVDKAGRGFITGDEAVPFFMNSKLPEEVLATIWELADIDSDGRLNRDEFAVAMHLIRQQRTRPGGRELPTTLPANLIPPSMRQRSLPPPQPTAPSFPEAGFSAPQTMPKSAADDLFGLDSFTSTPPQQSQGTGLGSTAARGFDNDFFGGSNKAGSPTSPSRSSQQPISPQQSSVFKPFAPSSSFGQSLTSSATGGSTGSNPPQNRGFQPTQSSNVDDLLGDNDNDPVSKKLTSESSELGNLSNQVGTLTKSMQEVKAKKGATQQDLSQAQQQKQQFEARLQELRSLYEQEVRDVKSLEERLALSRSETRKLQQDSAMLDGTYQDIQAQHHQLSAALAADQNDNRTLKQRMAQVNQEIGNLKPQLEKLRSEARQQKGLVSISKKQLSTAESERDKMKGDIQGLEKSAAESAAESARSPPVQSPAVASPSSQTTNPFHRKSPPVTNENAMSPSPFAPGVAAPASAQSTFDSMFGPSYNSQGALAPTTSFAPEQGRHVPEPPSVSTEGPDFPTPASSPPASTFHDSPRVTDNPPPPPADRQISSSYLPFRENAQRSDSLTSSTKVAPPSRFGGNDQSRADTPTNWVGSASDTPNQEQDSFLSGGNSRSMSYEQPPRIGELERTDTEKTETAPITRDSGSPEISDSTRPVTKTNESFGFGPSTSQINSIPGAFPPESTSPLQATATGESALSDRSKDSSRPSETFGTARADPFGGQNSRAPTNTKEDFDAAFASFGPPKLATQERQNTGGSTSQDGSIGASSGTGAPVRFNKEFPPIEELHHDEESDSASEHGFDDNFTAASPEQKHSRMQSNAGTENSSTRPSGPQQVASSGAPPSATAQQAPPTYGETISPPGKPSSPRDSNQFPAEFGGLLPSRVDPTASQASPEKSFASPTGGSNFFGTSSSRGATSSAPTNFSASPPPSNTPPSTTGTSEQYHSAASHPSSQAAKGTSPTPAGYGGGAFDDDEFAGLEEAKEADTADDSFDVIPSHRHEGLDEFNPVFDSPAASKSNTMMSQQTATGSSSTVHAPDDGFYDFEHNIGSTSFSTPNASKAKAPAPAAGGDDWDAIFAGLDNQGSTASGVAQSLGSSVQQPPVPAKEQLSPVAAEPSGSNGDAGSSQTLQKPTLGRSMTAASEHDDPILKNLTGMGFKRGDALMALEKFDYNIDKVCSHTVDICYQCLAYH
jgi:epidermal growth factor receptor substrate 15